MQSSSFYHERLNEVRSLLPEGSHLLIVSKMRTTDEIRAYYDLGQRDFGENRVPELAEKAAALALICPEIRWHMIGHLQSNKINALFSVPHLKSIHSVDDLALLEKLIKAQDRLNEVIDIFLQVNTSFEEEKSGLENETDLKRAAQMLDSCQKLLLRGLMTMGKIRTEDFETDARKCFSLLNEQRDRLDRDLETSMGMSQDYKIALEEGSNWIRLGTMMFNP